MKYMDGPSTGREDRDSVEKKSDKINIAALSRDFVKTQIALQDFVAPRR